MRGYWYGILGLCVVVSGAALLSRTSTYEGDWAGYEGVARHLTTIEGELRRRDVSHLSPELRGARERSLDRLHEYAHAGVFPRNTEFSDAASPVFIDGEHRACAVADLMIGSGHGDLARAVSVAENFDRVASFDTPGVAEWIAQSGLTAQEVARIQPAYCPSSRGSSPHCSEYCSIDHVRTVWLCDTPEDWEVAYPGPCLCEGCPNEDDWELGDRWARGPVCGEDGLDYQNECHARLCRNVGVERRGTCPTSHSVHEGDDDGQLACRSSGVTPGPLALALIAFGWRRRSKLA